MDFDAGKQSIPGLCSSELGDSENLSSHVSSGEFPAGLQVGEPKPSHGE